jgi:Putative peptidoglycan binding domain
MRSRERVFAGRDVHGSGRWSIGMRCATVAWMAAIGLGVGMILLGAPCARASSRASAEPVGSPAPVLPAAHVPTPAPRFVRDAQRALRDLGYAPGPMDGIVGPRTREALRRYQRSEGLPTTGRLDVETMARLDVHQRLFRSRRPARDVRAGAGAGVGS